MCKLAVINHGSIASSIQAKLLSNKCFMAGKQLKKGDVAFAKVEDNIHLLGLIEGSVSFNHVNKFGIASIHEMVSTKEKADEKGIKFFRAKSVGGATKVISVAEFAKKIGAKAEDIAAGTFNPTEAHLEKALKLAEEMVVEQVESNFVSMDFGI